MVNNFSNLIKKIKSCKDCKSLFGFEPKPIFMGNENAKILQISQAPSKKAHNTGICFNDDSGKKLRNDWYRISDEDFYNNDNFYISGIGHCYPRKNSKGVDKKTSKILC